MKRVIQVIAILVAIGAMVQTLAGAAEKGKSSGKASANQASGARGAGGKGKTVLMARGGEPGI